MTFERLQAKGRGHRVRTPEELEEAHKQEIAKKDKYIKELEDKVFEQEVLGGKKEKKPKQPLEDERERWLREFMEEHFFRRGS